MNRRGFLGRLGALASAALLPKAPPFPPVPEPVEAPPFPAVPEFQPDLKPAEIPGGASFCTNVVYTRKPYMVKDGYVHFIGWDD